MSNIKIDTDVQDQIRDEMKYAVTAAEEAEVTLKQTVSEMSEDLSGYYDLPQWGEVVNLTEQALTDIGKVAERLSMLENAIMNVSAEYSDVEKKHTDSLNDVTEHMTVSAYNITAAMNSDFPVGIEESEEESSLRQLEQSLSNTVVSMEISNLAAVSKVVEEEYNYENVRPVSYVDVSGADTDKDDEENSKQNIEAEEENK